MERGMRQRSRWRNSGEDVKIMIKLEIKLEIELENELENGSMNVLLIVLEIVLEIELEIELENGPMNVLLIVLLIVLEIALDIDQEFESHFKISSLPIKCAFHCFVFALMDLSPRKMEKAGEAIDFLSSLPGTSGGVSFTIECFHHTHILNFTQQLIFIIFLTLFLPL